MSRALRVVRYLVLILLIVASTGAMTLFYYLHGSLPVMEGNHIVPGLRAKVDIARDEQGVPTLNGTHREDIAFGLGYLHAQERFFQMDLSRRLPAGELSALLGADHLTQDRLRRTYQLRPLARRMLAEASVRQRSIIESYTRGVNQGLQGLTQPPFEYLLLQSSPAPWQPEDSVLVLLARFLEQQEDTLWRDLSLVALEQHLPPDWATFMRPAGGDWDAPLSGLPTALAPPLPEQPLAEWLPEGTPGQPVPDSTVAGGNLLATSGTLNPDGRAILAQDQHERLTLPNAWYRARWQLPQGGRWVTGVTRPGFPAMISGSNQQLAWAWSNAFVRSGEFIRLEVRGDTYRTPDGWEPFQESTERIAIRGSSPQAMTIRQTRWGPVVGQDDGGHWLALRWSALSTDTLDLSLLDMEQAASLSEGLAIAANLVAPQNLLLADQAGDIAWTLGGALPDFQGAAMTSLRDGAELEDSGPLSGSSERPQVLDQHRLWSANQKPLATLEPALDGGFARGARAQQLRAGLHNLSSVDEAALRDLQLDHRALLLERWRTQMLGVLEQTDIELPSALDNELSRSQLLMAEPDSLAYPLVRAYRQAVMERALGPIYQHVAAQSDRFQVAHVAQQAEYPAWALVSAADPHHLNPAYASWDELWEAALHQALEQTRTELGPQAWAAQNTGRLAHPLSHWLPALDPVLNLPADGLPGDHHMPRRQHNDFGVTLRMVVAPGHEQHGLFHMAGSQSGHPISPYYRNGHADWLEAAPTPFLPGPAEYQMSLFPQR
ncbi:penicillin acylase family protein [Natronospirillum operosum]|uniref:Penicillin acylase family protein n=1 Tax=Natronospirillum operosum TaxID=2759953 RepID=A0A4Z0WC83_9GAMM|nr:penicillin acylase family protein [Natronospirillum operosum]TGG94145.1 penicillin acylase family protein [Natronospirillum operosum]